MSRFRFSVIGSAGSNWNRWPITGVANIGSENRKVPYELHNTFSITTVKLWIDRKMPYKLHSAFSITIVDLLIDRSQTNDSLNFTRERTICLQSTTKIANFDVKPKHTTLHLLCDFCRTEMTRWRHYITLLFCLSYVVSKCWIKNCLC